jgi:hypothetical protein
MLNKMKTAEKNAKDVQGTNAKKNNTPRIENRPNLTGKEAKTDESAKDEKPAEAAKAEATQPPKQRPILPLQWITNPLTLRPTQQDRD